MNIKDILNANLLKIKKNINYKIDDIKYSIKSLQSKKEIINKEILEIESLFKQYNWLKDQIEKL